MYKKIHLLLALLIIASFVLGACASPAPAPAPAEPQLPVVQPTDVPPLPPTAVPQPEPEPEPEPEPVAEIDLLAMAQSMADLMPQDKYYLSIQPVKLMEELAEKAPFLVDLREPSEIEKDGFIEGAINLPIRELLNNLDKLPSFDEAVVVYCGVGHRGGFALAALTSLGYTNVRSLNGGLATWKSAELPLVSGAMNEAKVISSPIIADQALFALWNDFLSGLPEGFFLVRPDGLAERLASDPVPYILDLRTKGEFDKDGYIEGAVNIPFNDLFANVDQLPSMDTPIVVMCGIGHRGAVVLPVLKMMGYENVTSLYMGMRGWKSAKMPVAGWVDWMSVWKEYFAGIPANFYGIKPDGLNAALAENPPFMVDLREAGEIEQNGYIEGAVHIPVRELLKSLDKLPAQDQPIVLICASGHRGGFGIAALQLLGYKDVANLVGGLGAWKKEGFPVEDGMPAKAEVISTPVVDETRLRDLDAWFSAIPDNLYAVSAVNLNTELVDGKEVFIIDNRTAAEVENGFVEGSVHIAIHDLFEELAQLPADKSTEIVLVCQSGHRGGIGLIALRMIGYTNVRNMGGGMGAWAAAELPVVQ